MFRSDMLDALLSLILLTVPALDKTKTKLKAINYY